MNTDIMIDLETLDVLPTSTILTIGAVKFDPFGDDIKEKKADGLDFSSFFTEEKVSQHYGNGKKKK